MKQRTRYSKHFLCIVGILFLICLAAMPVFGVDTGSDTLDFVILLDCTGSMRSSDEYEICSAAADMFVDLTPSSNARVSIIAFGQRWYDSQTAKKMNLTYSSYQYTSKELQSVTGQLTSAEREYVSLAMPLSKVDKNEMRAKLKQVISDCIVSKKDTRLVVDGQKQNNSYIGGALLAASDLLHTAHSENAAVILLSDGRLNGFTYEMKESDYIKRSNYDLLELSLDNCSRNGWSVYTVELNADRKNASIRLGTKDRNSSLSPSEIMRKISSETGGVNNEITEIQMGTLAQAFMNVFSTFMEAEPKTQKGMLDTQGLYRTSLSIPEVTSETNIVITGGEIVSFTANGTTYAKNGSDNSAYCVINESKGKYSLLKLLSPKNGEIDLSVKGQPGSDIVIQYVSTQDLPIGFTSSGNNYIDRNTVLTFRTYLASAGTGNPVTADAFYNNQAKAYLTITDNTGKKYADRIAMIPSADGYSSSFDFENAGNYTVTAAIESQSFRKGVKTYTQRITVGDYTLKTELENASSGIFSREDTVNIYSRFYGQHGNAITGTEIYKKNEAVVRVKKNGTTITELAMNADQEGYHAEFRFDATGKYTFETIAKAASLHHVPESLFVVSPEYTVQDYTFTVIPTVSLPDENETAYQEGKSYAKNSRVTFAAQLLNYEGIPISGSSLLSSDALHVTVIRSGQVIDSFDFTENDARDTLIGVWNASYAGDILLEFVLADPAGDKKVVIEMNIVNQKPTLLKQYDGTDTIPVGSEISVAIDEYFRDADGDVLIPTVSFHNSENNAHEMGWTYTEEDRIVQITAGGKHNTCTVEISVSDNDTETAFSFPLNCTNQPPRLKHGMEFDLPLLSLYNIWNLIPGKDIPSSLDIRISDYFEDPENLPMQYSFVSDNACAVFDEAEGLLSVHPENAENVKFELVLTDSDGEQLTVKKTVSVENWAAKNAVILSISGILFAGLLVFLLRQKKVGHVTLIITVGGQAERTYTSVVRKRKYNLRVFLKTAAKNKGVQTEQFILDELNKIGLKDGTVVSGAFGKIRFKGLKRVKIAVGNGDFTPAKKITLKKNGKVRISFENTVIEVHNKNR